MRPLFSVSADKLPTCCSGRFPSISAAEWPMLQNDDPHICRVVGILHGNQQWPVNLYDESIEVRQMLLGRCWLFLKDNIIALRVLHQNSTIEEDSIDTTLENSHDFYQIDPEEESESARSWS